MPSPLRLLLQLPSLIASHVFPRAQHAAIRTDRTGSRIVVVMAKWARPLMTGSCWTSGNMTSAPNTLHAVARTAATESLVAASETSVVSATRRVWGRWHSSSSGTSPMQLRAAERTCTEQKQGVYLLVMDIWDPQCNQRVSVEPL